MACQAGAGVSSKTLYAYIEMPASEFNAQEFVKAEDHPLQTVGASWIAYNGGFNLRTRLGDREMEFPISDRNGGIQIAGWRGRDGSYSEPHIDALVFVIDPQNLSYEEASQIAAGYCQEASAAGLDKLESRYGKGDRLPEAKVEAVASMNGIAACSIRNDRESFEVRIVPHDHGDLETRFKIRISIHAYFEVELP